jgi:hypothetical protein
LRRLGEFSRSADHCYHDRLTPAPSHDQMKYRQAHIVSQVQIINNKDDRVLFG